ncbi:MAG: lysine exporter LysO family protein [Muribaculaceae bacterium]
MFGALRGSAVIVAFFVVGVVLSATGIVGFDIAKTQIGFYALCALMATVGLSVGSDTTTLRRFKSIDPRLALLPFFTIIGTSVGSVAVSFMLQDRSVTDCLAVGSGLAYYSLSSIFITQYRGAELGTIALLANIFREITTLLAAPLLVRWFGKLAAISSGGATSMDTTLPIITRTAGTQMVVVSVFHGFVADFSVPYMVALWCSL